MKYIALFSLTFKVWCQGIGHLSTTGLLLEVDKPTYHNSLYLWCYKFYYNITYALSPFLARVLQEYSRGKDNALCRSAQINGKIFRIIFPELSARKELSKNINPHSFNFNFFFFYLSIAADIGNPASHQEHKFCFPAQILCDYQWTT